MALNLYTSNRMELLVEYLSMVLEQEKLPPLDSEVIIVQSQGMARFLAMELARRKGVWAGGVFPFPNAFLQDVFGQILEEETGLKAWQRTPLAWRIFNILPHLLSEPGFEVLAAYCQTPEKTFQLSQQISDLFDQYVLYRPEMIQAWSQGQESSWQALLWQHLLKDLQQPHRAEQFRAVLRQLSGRVTVDLPRRISLFGLSSMAPLMIDVFAALGSHTEVNVFFLNPCQVEWSQIMTSGAITRVELATGQDKESQFLESGNELLASMGHLGRDFFDLLLGHDPVVHSMFVPAPSATLLGSLQNDILDLLPPDAGHAPDDSLHLVSCHNGMREVEVLLDHLLHLFSDHDDLQPRDVLVMAPDIGVYAPLIDAVFRETGREVPYTIADQSMQEQECFVGFLELLKVAKGRWRVTEIMALMELPPLCRRFGFSEDDLAVVKEWLHEVHVHWGRDGHHWKGLGLPPASEHSFRYGINRLLLGFAMDGDGLFMGMLPFQGGELDGEVAGKFLSFYEQLLELAIFLEGEKSVQAWSRGLLDAVDDFFAPTSEQEWEIGQLRTILASLAHDAEIGSFSQDVSPEIIEIWLKKALQLDLSPYGFLSGGITFCSLLPMRAIPFQVVCLLGMNDGDFPRNQIRPGFDLTARDFRRGDRNKRNDDRYLFLEAILSARRQLYISYVGRSMTDNRQILPSVLVSEVLDYLAICLGGVQAEELVVQHRIQPFHSDYFDGSLPRSFSAENYQACRTFQERSGQDGSDFLAELAVSEPPALCELALHDFLNFWQNPTAFFCRKTLGLVWQDSENSFVDDEPFALAGLGKYGVEQHCLDLLLHDEEVQLARVRAAGLLPHGVVGEMEFGRVASRADQLARRLQPLMTDPCDLVQTQLCCGDYSLDVQLTHLFAQGQVVVRIGQIDGRHILKAWLSHLVLQLVDAPCVKTTFLVGTDELVILPPVTDAEPILLALLGLYRQGITMPLPFFVKSSWEYVKTTREKGDAAGLKKAQDTFAPGYKQFATECDDPAIQRCFGEKYLLGERFVSLSQQVFTPFLDGSGYV